MTDDREMGVWVKKDGRAWRIGGEAEVAWIRENTEVPNPLEDAIANMAVIEALFRSAHSGKWEIPERQ